MAHKKLGTKKYKLQDNIMKKLKIGKTHLIIFLFIIVGIFFWSITKTSTLSTTPTVEETTTIGCSRTTRIENSPQYDRALSFIQQRIDENHDGRFTYNRMHLFEYFPANLVNCIKIVEETPADGSEFEGYFTLNGKDIKNDYFPIVVNSKYKQSDDTLIAFLLSHEITHVQQYIDSVNNKEELSCIDKEVQAFLAQHRFLISVLNSQEMILVLDRIYEAEENNKNATLRELLPNEFDGQLLILGTIMELRRNTPCETPEGETLWDRLPDQAYYDCVDRIVPITLGELIRKDSYYKKQCEL